jgi:hypothetical protein
MYGSCPAEHPIHLSYTIKIDHRPPAHSHRRKPTEIHGKPRLAREFAEKFAMFHMGDDPKVPGALNSAIPVPVSSC